jgi:hypothetical protein
MRLDDILIIQDEIREPHPTERRRDNRPDAATPDDVQLCPHIDVFQKCLMPCCVHPITSTHSHDSNNSFEHHTTKSSLSPNHNIHISPI